MCWLNYFFPLLSFNFEVYQTYEKVFYITITIYLGCMVLPCIKTSLSRPLLLMFCFVIVYDPDLKYIYIIIYLYCEDTLGERKPRNRMLFWMSLMEGFSQSNSFNMTNMVRQIQTFVGSHMHQHTTLQLIFFAKKLFMVTH